jgi:hypothetical protein
MIFLHPVILTNAIEGTLSTNEKYNYMRQEQITARQKGVALLPQAQTPVLPPQEQVRQRNTLLDTAPKPAPKPAEPKTAPAVIEQGFNNK